MNSNQIIVSATPKKTLPEGWDEGVNEAVLVQAMSTGKFAIFRRSSVPVKSGYKVYDSISSMEKDFKLHRADR